MEITLCSLLNKLGQTYKIVCNGHLDDSMQICQVALWTNSPLHGNTLYLNPNAPVLSDEHILNIVSNEESIRQPGWYLVCSQDHCFQAVNDCFLVWQEYLQWQGQCRELAHIEHNLSGLLHAGADYLAVDMIIIDRAYRFDGGSLTKNSCDDDFFGNTVDMDAKMVEDLYAINPHFDETFHTDGLINYPFSPSAEYELYYFNLRYDKLYLGRLLIRIPRSRDNAGFRHLATGFGRLVSQCYGFHYLRKNKGMSRYSLYDIWKVLLEGKPVDEETAHRKLQAIGWAPDHRYQILYLVSTGYFRSQETLKFYAVQLEQTFSACIAAQMEEGIYLLHDLDCEDDPDFRQHLADFLRENLFLTGISNVFQSFYDSACYRRQARDALELGLQKNPNLWRHEFRDYQADYILRQCLRHYPARDLCPAQLEKLLLHDEAHPDMELVKTLEVYYRCKFNASEAAKQLFIHRTTLFYRLNKIQQIAAINHDDPNLRLQIQLCFALLGMK